MTSALLALSQAQLLGLATALRRGSVAVPPRAFSIAPFASTASAPAVAAELRRLHKAGHTALHLAETLTLLASQRAHVEAERGAHDLVWTGPSVPGAGTRDTHVVIQELFSSAERHILLSTYAIYDGATFFQGLHERMLEVPGLTVDLFANVPPAAGGQDAKSRFVADFRQFHWPWTDRLPNVFYDPRSLEPHEKAVLHAKCIVVDGLRALITSANFTDSASQRNVELGVLTTEPALVQSLARQWRGLIQSGAMVRLPL